MSCRVTHTHVMSRHFTSRHVTSRHVTSRHVMSCHVMSLMSCHVMSCHVMSRHDTLESCSRIFLPSLLNSSIMAAGWQRRGFRNRGPVRESGSERRSRCGAARIATVPRGRRGGWCDLGIVLRGRLRGSGVPRACRGCAAALCRGDWVRGAFCTRMANVRFAWQAAGIVRAGRRVAGMSRVCRGAVPWGLGSGRVLYTHGQRAFRVAGCGDRACWEVCRGCVAGMPRRCAVGIGFRACRVCGVRGAVPWGLQVGAPRGCRCAMGLLLGVSRGCRWAAVCHGDCCWACRVGGAVPWGLC